MKPSSIAGQTQSFARGQTIFNQGDAGEVMYIVMDGQVELFVDHESVESVGRDGLIGELALVDAAPRSASAIARTDCKLLPITRKKFTLLVQDRPDFALHIMRVMAGRLRHMDHRLQRAAVLDTASSPTA